MKGHDEYTTPNNCYEVINKVSQQAVRKENKPYILRFDKAIERLEGIVPILEGIDKRQDRQLIMIIMLGVAMIAMGFILK